MQAEALADPALFRSTHAALTFAFNATRATQGLSVIGRLMGGPAPANRGLGGLDGAAQAGMIKAEIATLTPIIRGYIITARFAMRGLPCDCRRSCCSGTKINHEWADAIESIADMVRSGALAGTVCNYTLRHIIVRRYFGVRSSLKAAAMASSVNVDTASLHAARVIGYLREQERLGFWEVEGRLKRAGIVADHPSWCTAS